MGLIGALMALLFADWLVYPVLHFQSIHSFVMHGLLLGYIVMLIWSQELKPNEKLLPQVFILFLLVLILFSKVKMQFHKIPPIIKLRVIFLFLLINCNFPKITFS